MTQRHLKSGDPMPPVTQGTLRLYSMYFCPFAQRVRLVLAHKNIPHETVNIHLKQKPDWFFERNPQGKVPALEIDGKVIVESAICMDYLDEKYPGYNLYPKDPLEKATTKMKMEIINSFNSAFFKVWFGGEAKLAENIEKLEEEFSKVNNVIDGQYMLGDTVTMADYFIWPWIERTCIFTAMLGYDVIDQTKYPKLAAWRDAMVENPAVKETINTVETYERFFKSAKSGTPDIDFLF